jgi:hypothetical protein
MGKLAPYEFSALKSENAALKSRLAEAEDSLQKIYNWSCAYPLDIFPEPDFKKVRALLEGGGITLDSVSASNMRHVVEGVGNIARAFLHPEISEKEG